METKRDYIVRLRELLIARLNLDELRTLCFDIGLDYDSLEGGTKDGKIRELLSHVERRDKLAFLIECVKGQRPDLARDIANLEVLRRQGAVVEDQPDDEVLPDPGVSSTHQQSNKRQLYRRRTGRWLWMTVGGIVMILVAIGFWWRSHPIPTAENTRADRSTAISMQSAATKSTKAPFATSIPRPASSDNAAQQSLTLPAGMEAKLAGGKIIIKILTLRLEPLNAEKRTLRATVRLTNNSEDYTSEYETLFRLLVDDVPRAPIETPGGGVKAQSAKEFDYAFEVPTRTSKVVLRLMRDQQTTDIPLDLATATP
jgi:hypothetical protein